ncbi:LPD38 domain-containing protein [Bradyrhizobium ottawaense]
MVPNHVPRAFIERFQTDDDTFTELNKTVGNTVAGRIAAALFEGAEAGFGDHPLGISPEDAKKLQKLGIFQDPEAPKDITSGIRFMNEAAMRPAVAAVSAFFRAGNAAIYGAGATLGQVAAEVTGANEAEAARARRDGAQFATVATLLAMGHPVSRTEIGPMGEVRTQPIGSIPRSEDFVAAAEIVAGEKAPMPVQEKLLAAYQEKGLHPSEVAHDAMSDPVVAQSLLSSDKADLPPGGPPKGPPEPPKPPAEPPPPPPEGSFEAAQKTILDKISVGEAPPKQGWSWDKFYTQAIDDLHPLKGVDEDAYQLARLTRGQFGKAEHFIEHGTFDFETYKTNGPALKDILEPMSKDLDGLRAYLASKRALEIEGSGRKSGMDVEAAQRVAAEGEGKYGKAAAEIVDYQNKLLKYLKDSGVLSDKAFDAMVEAGKNYIPFYRVMEPETGAGAGKSFGPGNPVKKLKGSERDVVDPLESIIKNTYAYVSIAERNAVGIKLIDALKKDGAEVAVSRAKSDPELVNYLKENGVTDPEAIVDFVKSAVPESGDTLGAFRDGVKETVKVNDPELVTAFRGLDQQSASLIAQVLAPPARWLRTGATLSPDFMARNIVRDFMTAFVNSKGALFSPVDTAKGLAGVIRKDADFQDWLKGGGANSTMVALDRRYMQESLRSLAGETGLMERSWNVITSPYRALRMVSELAENATRLGEFKKSVSAGGKAEIQAAAFASREVTLDFARIGANMRGANMAVAFMNAQLQGLDRVARGFADRPVNTMAKVAGGITLPSILLWWANKDDPRYKELPSWQRDLFWIVMTKDHVYRIPKPFELGVVFGSGVERTLESYFNDNPEAFDKFGKTLWEVVTPSIVPTAAQPIVEQWANRSSMSDRTLIPHEMEKFLPEYQYTPYTTELAKKLGQVVSAFPGMRSTAVGPGAPFGPVARAASSPILLENYIRAWTGGLGVYALQAADASLRKTGVLPDPVTPTPTLADIPVVKAFVVRYPSASTQSIQDFYDKHETTKAYYDTWLAKAKEGDADAMARIQAAGGPIMFVRLDAIKDTLSEHSKLVRDIYKNPTIKPEEKRQLIDGLYFNMIQIGQAGKKMLTDSEKALQTATEAAP